MAGTGFADGLADLAAAAQLRTRRVVETAPGATVVVAGRRIVSFAGNDYLGLANDPRLVVAAIEGATRYGVGSGASHLVSGHSVAHEALEARLAEFCGMERALFFGSGYLANQGILVALATRGSVIHGDKLNHACLYDGALLSRAEFKRYNHLDLAQLRRHLETTPPAAGGRTIIATDAVFSMDGDIAPLAELLELAERHDALLVVDDAHGFGVLGAGGRGTLAQLGLASPRIVYMATLGKAAGVYGAFVAGRADIVEWILQKARSYIFTTAAPPLIAHALLTAVQCVEADVWRRTHLAMLVALLRSSLALKRWRHADSHTAIQPIVIGDNAATLAAAAALYERGFWTPAIRPPTVPPGTARLRISLSAAHSREDVLALVDALHSAEAGARMDA